MDSSVYLLVRGALRAADSSSCASWSSCPTDDGGVFPLAERNEDLRNDPNNPDFIRLVKYVLWIRWFAKTYNGVLLAVLLIITASHWGSKLWTRLHARKTRSARARAIAVESEAVDVKTHWDEGTKSGEYNEYSVASESSGSSLSEDSTTPVAHLHAEGDEDTPLLGGNIRRLSWIRVGINRLRGWLLYQPRPLPIINRVLPDNGTSVAVALFVALNFFYWLYGLPWDRWFIFLTADRAGLVFAANLPVLYLFAAKNQPIRLLTGYSYEALNIFHRKVGEVMCFFAFLHFVGMMLVWYTAFRLRGDDLITFLTNWMVALGIGAFVAYETLYFTSLGSFRVAWYEIFLALHIFLQVAGLALLFFHDEKSRVYVLISIGIFLVDRLIFRLFINSTTFPADLTVLEDGETVLLSANWSLPQRSALQRLLDPSLKTGWSANDHVFITVPELSRSAIFQAHPFTIASAAPDESPSHAWFSLLIRAYDGFTRSLLNHAVEHPGTPVTVRTDGPYSSTHAVDLLEASDEVLIVGGGSGIAVAFPLVWSLLHRRPTTGDQEDGIHPRRHRIVHLVWVVRSRSHLSWIPTERFEELQEMGLRLRIEPPTSEAGRPDMKGMVEKLVEGPATPRKLGVVVSGPDPLVRDVRNACATCVSRGHDVSIAVEKFGW
jgi:NAD(P)H-flavin reductase